MNEGQVWALIGVFGSVSLGSLVFMLRVMTFTLRTVKAEIAGVGERLDAKIDAVEQGLDAKIDDRFDRVTEVMNVRFDSVEHRLGALEEDSRLVKARLIGTAQAD